jgi:hypothetical protein
MRCTRAEIAEIKFCAGNVQEIFHVHKKGHYKSGLSC